MRAVGLVLEDGAVPRTVFYERLLEAVRRHPWHREAGSLLIPAEDTAQETNWPRYGARASAYVRGAQPDLSPGGPFVGYLNALAAEASRRPGDRLLVVNMHPFVRLANAFKPFRNVIVADGSLAAHERALNPRTISMPALPIVRLRPPSAAAARPILASFQGAPSHPVRAELARIGNGADIVVNLIDPKNHLGRIDAEAGRTDLSYEDLLDASVFSFVPRGDALFSYRLLEVMARGSIPVILSDGWVLPFDRTVDWPSLSVSVHHEAVPKLPEILRGFTPEDVDRLRTNGARTYETVFADLDRIVDALLGEADRLPL
jgi:hypothetical protein